MASKPVICSVPGGGKLDCHLLIMPSSNWSVSIRRGGAWSKMTREQREEAKEELLQVLSSRVRAVTQIAIAEWTVVLGPEPRLKGQNQADTPECDPPKSAGMDAKGGSQDN